MKNTLIFEMDVETDGLAMADDLGGTLAEHLPIPPWVTAMRFIGVQVDAVTPEEEAMGDHPDAPNSGDIGPHIEEEWRDRWA